MLTREGEGLYSLKMHRSPIALIALACLSFPFSGQSLQQSSGTSPPQPAGQIRRQPAGETPQTPGPPTRANILRGEYGPYRANNDLLYYQLTVRVDPAKKSLAGKNLIRFKMLKDDSRIQLDLHEALNIDKIALGTTTLKYTREEGAVFVDFPETLHAGRTYEIEFDYAGTPVSTGRFGGITFKQDPAGRP